MKRREFVVSAGASALALGAVKSAVGADSAPTGESYAIGDFALQRTATGLAVVHKDNPSRPLWETAPDDQFLEAQRADATITEVGAPEGTFAIADTVTASFTTPSIDAIAASTDGPVTVSGKLTGDNKSIGYTITFAAPSGQHLRFVITTDDASINRIRLVSASVAEEAIFGCGSQLTYFNQKGKLLPILVQEHGIGRGLPIITRLVDVLDYQSGGDPYHTSFPAPYVITSRLRSLFLENLEYSEFDMRRAEAIDIKLWSGSMAGRILYGDTPLDILEAYTEYTGRMRPLPDWVHEGVILSPMGGSEIVNTRLARAVQAGVPVAGLWLQDWVGTRHTEAGTQLWWNWFLDEQYYPGWQDIVASVNGHVLIYINPFLATEAGHDQLFQEAKANGYLVQHADGSPYLIRNSGFSVGMLDLSNPGTRTWIKGVMKTNMIGKASAVGWMNDFGEALPFDAKLFDGSDPATWHNRYPEEWQRVNREAIEETGRGDQMVFFARSGYTQSPGISTLFWLGDQLMSWDDYDGIKTALVGILSGGISGFSLMHSDIGGYVVLKLQIAGQTVPVINRTEELMLRWVELNAFTAVMRTNEGIAPELAVQFDSSDTILAQFARFGTLFKALAPYRKQLVADAAAKGYPLVRHLFLHYPDDPNVYDLRLQFLLGPDMLVAPVLDKGATTVEVYFPHGDEWTDLWTGKPAGTHGRFLTMPAPIGKPAVFLRQGGADSAAIAAAIKAAGLL